jgi:hypothetical protein
MGRWAKWLGAVLVPLFFLGAFLPGLAAAPLTPEEIVKSTIVKLDMSAFPRDPGPAYEVRGQVFHVSPKGNDAGQGEEAAPLRTIAKAVELAQPGDKVVVHEGRYQEAIYPHLAIELHKDNFVLTAASGETVTVVAREGEKYGIDIAANGVVVNGINLEGFETAISIDAGEGKTCKNLIITNLHVAMKSGMFTDGICAFGDNRNVPGKPPTLDGFLLRNVTVENVCLGVSCNSGPCRNWWLDNVTVRGAHGGGDTAADCIAIEEGDHILITGADVSGAEGDGIDTKATRVVVMNSRVTNVARNGIKFWHECDVINTIVDGCDADAAVIFDGPGTYRLLHCLIAHHNWTDKASAYVLTAGYDATGNFDITIANTIFFEHSDGGLYFPPSAKVRVLSCLFSRMGEKAFDRGPDHSTNFSGKADVFAQAGIGAGNFITDDPRLELAKPGELRVSDKGPVIDGGVKLDGPTPVKDIAGKPRLQGSAPDLGPYEVR